MKLKPLQGAWTIDASTIPLICVGDVVVFTVQKKKVGTVIVRVRRQGVTVLLGVGFVAEGLLILQLTFGQVHFWIQNKMLWFYAVTFEGGPSPEGGGTSVGPPVKS